MVAACVLKASPWFSGFHSLLWRFVWLVHVVVASTIWRCEANPRKAAIITYNNSFISRGPGHNQTSMNSFGFAGGEAGWVQAHCLREDRGGPRSCYSLHWMRVAHN